MFNFILMNLLVVGSCLLLLKNFLYFKNALDYIISFFLLFFAQIILTLQLLGFLNILYLHNVILLNLLLLLLVWLIVKITRPQIRHNLPAKFNVLISELKFRRIEIICFSLILGFVIVKIYLNLINPPFGWDSLNYHFTFPVEWMKNGNLLNPIVVSDDPFPTYYPINGSLLFLWFILPFKSAFLADLGQLPFFLISFVGVFSICKKLKLNGQYSFFAACLFVMIPNFFKQLQIGYVDIMVSTIFLIAVNFILRLNERFNLRDIILFAISFGILIGIKATAIPYSIFVLAPFLYILFSQKQMSIIKKSYNMAFFLIMVLIFGSFAYFRNLILTGNPLYPIEVMVFGKTILKGVIDSTTFTYRNEAEGFSLIKLLFHEGLGIQSLLIVLPGTIFAFIINIFKRKDFNLFLNYCLCLPLLLYLTYRFIMPIPNSRYLYVVLAMGMIAGFYVLQILKVPLKIIRIATLIIMIIAAAECAHRTELIISFLASILLFLVFLFFSKFKRCKIILSSKTAIVSIILISFVILKLLLFNYEKNEYLRYVKNSRYWPDATLAWLWLNHNSDGNNIAYVGRPVPYPLYGTNFKNNVSYVSVNSFEPIHLHDLAHSKYNWDSPENMHKNFRQPNNYRGNADYAVWLNNLNERKIDFLFIYSLHHTQTVKFPIEELWAKDYPEKFNLVFNNETIRIYKLIE